MKINDQIYAFQIHRQKPSLPFLLMLHGFMGDHRAFEHLLESMGDFCNPITVDLLGHGQTSKPQDSSRYREQQQVSDLLTLATNLELPSRYLYGYSMGGRLALKTGLKHPDFFNGLILESTNCGIEDASDRKERKQKDADRAKAIKNNFSAFLNDWKDLDLFKSPQPRNEELIRKYDEMQASQSPGALAASLLGFGSGTMEPVCNQLTGLNLPVLLLAGTADKKYQHLSHYMAKNLENGNFQSVNAGHRIHLDNPAELIKHIQKFIKSH